MRSASIMELTNRINRSKQRLRNIEHGKASIDILDKALGEAKAVYFETDLDPDPKVLVLAIIVVVYQLITGRTGGHAHLFAKAIIERLKAA